MRLVPLRRVARLVNGGTPSDEAENWDGDVVWATPVDLAAVDGALVDRTQRTLTKAGLRTGSASVPAGSVLLSTRAPIGYLARTTAQTAFNQGCRGIVPGAALDARFLLYALTSARCSLIAAGTGSTFQELSSEALASTTLPLPSLPEQRRIADFLDDQVARLDAVLCQVRRMGDLVAERMRSRFVSLMLSGDSSAAKVAVRRLVLDERLGAWGDEAGGPYEVAVARVADFDRLQFTVGAVPTRRSLAAHQARPRLLRAGDTLLERSGGTFERPVGCVVTFFDADGTPTISSNFVSRLRPTRDCQPRYLTLVLAAMYEARWNRAWYTQTTGIQNLDSQAYLRLRVPRRDHEEQWGLVDAADHLLEQRTDARRQVAQIDQLLEERKRALITACVTGEFDVSTASTRAGDAALQRFR